MFASYRSSGFGGSNNSCNIGVLMPSLVAALAVIFSICFIAPAATAQDEIKLDCRPCIFRPSYKLRAIFHGTRYDRFWKQISEAAMQAAQDMRVQLDIKLYDSFDPELMANDILSVLETLNDRNKAPTDETPDALIVTIPAPVVEDAVKQVTDAGIPVFGLNSGYMERRRAGVLAWVAQDEYIAGGVAAQEFLRALQQRRESAGEESPTSPAENNTTRARALQQEEQQESGLVKGALFVNPEKGNAGLESRREGFANYMLKEAGVVVDELVVVGLVDDVMSLQTNSGNSTNCLPWNVVLLGSSLQGDLLNSILENEIFQQEACDDVVLGTFDVNESVLDNLRNNDNVLFSISQQNFIQGVLPVLFATLYVTTGKLPATPLEGDHGVYLSGPRVITKDNIPTLEEQKCADQVFPICADDGGGDAASTTGGGKNGCECTDRSKIKLAGVLHGVTIDSFWDIVFAASEMAANDMGIELDLERFEPEDTDELLHMAMANKINQVCNAGVDGLFVTIPSDLVVDSIQACLDKGVHVLSINAGAGAAEELGLVHHIGQLEFNAGFGAGKRIIDSGATKIWCLNHERGTQSLHQRCNGVAVAIAEASISNRNIEYGGEIYVPRSSEDIDEYKSSVETQVYTIISEDDDDWEDVGLVLTGPIQIKPAIELRKDHGKVLIGTFDTNDDLFDSLKSQQFLFGIDQQPFLQGYLPIPLLTYLSYTGQRLANPVIESGPSFVLSPPSKDQQICELNFYEVCLGDDPPPKDSGGIVGNLYPLVLSIVLLLSLVGTPPIL